MAIIKYLIVIFIVAGVVGGATYFIGFNNGREKEILAKRDEISNLQKKIAAAPPKTLSQDKEETDKLTEEVKSAQTSSPEVTDSQFEEYTVQDKDTLFTIGLKFDLTWEKIGNANGLAENAKLYIGQKLKIPKESAESPETGSTDIQINQDEATSQQKVANEQGADLWRRDPIEVVRKEAPASFKLLPGDPYSLLSKDVNLGKATVFLQKDSNSYTFNLIQPVDKGDDGIWKIDSIDKKTQ